jgi:hypothetical protein
MMGGDVTVNSVPGREQRLHPQSPRPRERAGAVESTVDLPPKRTFVVTQGIRETPRRRKALPPLGSSVLVIDDDATAARPDAGAS